MRKQFLKIIVAIAAVIAISCNKNELTDLNTPLNSVNYPIPANLFTGALLNTPKDSYSVLAQGMQYFSTYKEVPAIGDKFYSFNGTVADFGTTATAGTYNGQLNTLYQLMAAIQAPELINQRAMVRILRVYAYHQLTDVAGDIPYFDAIKGKKETFHQNMIHRKIFTWICLKSWMNQPHLSMLRSPPSEQPICIIKEMLPNGKSSLIR